jgi:apolipoprotein D and lipocalin family protein
MRLALAAWLFVSSVGQAPQTPPAPPPRPAASLDLAAFAGTYFEIARYPNEYQKQCAGDAQATYALRSDGRIDVTNRCRRADGTIAEARGAARRAGKGTSNAQLKVRFAPAWVSLLPRVWGNYWVLGAGPNCSYVVVGEPSRTYLWILSRLPRMSDLAYRQALEIATSNGYDVSKLVKTSQGRRVVGPVSSERASRFQLPASRFPLPASRFPLPASGFQL